MMSLSGLLIFMLVGFSAFALWWSLNSLKQLAFSQAARRCRESNVQILDSTISLKRLWWRRNDRGRIALWTLHEFEFSSTGARRYRGTVVMLGKRTELIDLEPHRITADE